MKQKICVLTGAGVSAESGIKTFRDADGLWEGHDVMAVASPQGWDSNRELVLDFYNQRRNQLHEVAPNRAHLAIVRLEPHYETVVITQNVDDLHERAGSTHVIHLHGELRKVRSCGDAELIYDWTGDLVDGDQCEKGYQLRPHIVWFGEAVPMLETAISHVSRADIIVIVGTSMQVYPAASLTAYAKADTPIYYIDPKPTVNYELSQQRNRLHIIEGLASSCVPDLVERLISQKTKRP
ncbi:MAG: NAD-dependent deacylase [Bacteroidota bacterium]